ncbi:MAG: terminase small subunit [Fibromonadaceae bacterium]|jgi:hypothetical protein|nr:terminase small subunit [Fibromonadaceae bacterium]
MGKSPSIGGVPAPCHEGQGVSVLEDCEQLELFPELPKEMPKNLGILRNGSKTMRFIAEYFLSGNATQSVLNAGYNCTRESARRMGHELLTRLDIRDTLEYLSSQIKIEALANKQNVILSILETRAAADVRGKFREVSECNRLLAQILGMLRETVEFSGNAALTLEDFRRLKKEASEGEARKKNLRNFHQSMNEAQNYRALLGSEIRITQKIRIQAINFGKNF